MVKSVLGWIARAAMDVEKDVPAARFIPRDDLIGYGAVGFCQARERFERERGTTFQSLAWIRVRGAILDGVRSEYRRGPKHMPEYKAYTAAMITHAPSPHELLEARELRTERRRLIAAAFAPLSEADRNFLVETLVEGRTLEEAGAALGITKSGASRRLKRLLSDCRRRAEALECR